MALEDGWQMVDPRWRRLRRLNRLVLGLGLGWMPFVLIVMNFQERYLAPPRGIILVLIYSAGFMIPGWMYAVSPCPNCGRPFASEDRIRFPWGPAQCDHCDIKLGDALPGAPIDPSEAKRSAVIEPPK